jgi:outer membrane protein assembly factor BamB
VKLATLLSLALAGAAFSQTGPHDWPQFLGPNRDGEYTGGGLAETWSKDGPPALWKKAVGEGWSGPAIADGKLILFHRIGDEETIECLDAKTGAKQWSSSYRAEYIDVFKTDAGPRSVPTIVDGRVYTLGANGILGCVELKNGRKVWRFDAAMKFGGDPCLFGRVCSPLMEGGAVYVNLGGKDGAGLVALDRKNGKLLWKATSQGTSYSSPQTATIDGRRYVLLFGTKGLSVLMPRLRRSVYEFSWRSRSHDSANAATPVVVGDQIFISAGYETGAALLRLKQGDLSQVWSGDENLSTHYATAVHRDGHLYGIHGNHDSGRGPELRCIEFNTGKVLWKAPSLAPANVTLVGPWLLILTEKGELIRAKASPDKFAASDRFQLLGSSVRAYPALAQGLFYARDKRRLVCLDLRK